MKLAARLQQITSSLHGWASLHPQWKIDFNSYVLATADGLVFIDPTQPTPPVVKKLEKLGAPLAIVLTNAHHNRAADWFRKRYEIQVYAHEKAAADCEIKIDIPVMDGERLPGGLLTICLPGVTTSEIALFTRDKGGAVLLGDAIIHTPGKGLQLLPDQYIEDRRQACASLKKLLELNFKVLTFAHGDPVTENAKTVLKAFLKKPGTR